MILPSFCIIFAVSVFLDRFLEIAWIAHAFLGIKISVGILILDAAVRMLRKLRREPAQIAFVLCAFAATVLITVFSANISSVVLMLTAGLAGLLVFIAREAAGKGGTGK